jgi:transcriptional regulator with XRE-family HTH domain
MRCRAQRWIVLTGFPHSTASSREFKRFNLLIVSLIQSETRSLINSSPLIFFRKFSHLWEIMKLSKTKCHHPVRWVRALAGKSRAKFARLFGISDSYVEAIERGDRQLTDELRDKIALLYGLDDRSLKLRSGFPRSVIDTKRLDFNSFYDPDLAEPPAGASDKEITAAMIAALDRGMELFQELEALPKVRNKYDRLQRSMIFWQKYVLHSKQSHTPVENVLSNKLGLLFEAAAQEEQFYPLAMELSRWIEHAVSKYRLRSAITVLRNSRDGEAGEWPTFMESLRNIWLNPERNDGEEP